MTKIREYAVADVPAVGKTSLFDLKGWWQLFLGVAMLFVVMPYSQNFGTAVRAFVQGLLGNLNLGGVLGSRAAAPQAPSDFVYH